MGFGRSPLNGGREGYEEIRRGELESRNDVFLLHKQAIVCRKHSSTCGWSNQRKRLQTTAIGSTFVFARHLQPY